MPVAYQLREPRERFATAKFHLGASLVRVTIPETRDGERGGGVRSAIGGFSYQSHKRLLLFLNSIAQVCTLPLFLTLTYPAQWSSDPREWKRHLKNFAQWMSNRFPGASYVWKLEPQERGAPHFHLMLWGVSFLPWQTIAVRWCEIVSGVLLDEPATWGHGKDGAAEFRAFCDKVSVSRPELVDHLRAGTECRAVRSRNGVKCYAGKQYMGKQFDGLEGVGRFWGVHNRKALPRPAPMRESAPVEALRCLARIARKSMNRQGYKVRHSRSFDLFTERPDEWERLFRLICSGAVGLGGAVLTRSEEDRIKEGARRASQAMAALGVGSSKPAAFVWD
jgi:hypothetical protein